MKQKYSLPGKMKICLMMILLASVMAVVGNGTHRWWCLCAVCLYAAGDLILMDIPWRKNSIRWRAETAMCMFGAGHLVMMGAYFQLTGPEGISLRPGADIGVVLWILSMFLMIIRGRERIRRMIGMLIYGMILCFLCAVSISCSQISGNWFGAWGAMSFYLSDLFLALNRLRSSNVLSRLVWVFYPLGVMLLILGL